MILRLHLHHIINNVHVEILQAHANEPPHSLVDK